MYAFLILITRLIDIYMWIIIAGVIMSWLLAFQVVNIRNRFVFSLANFLNALTEPLYRRIRQILPPLGGLDLSPLVLIFALMFIRSLLWDMFAY